MSWLVDLDKQIFLLINKDWAYPWLDSFFIFLTNAHKMNLVRFGLFPIGVLIWLYFGRKYALRALLVTGLVISASDLFAYRLVKPAVARTRPSHVVELGGIMRQPKPANGYSFPSNHAINSFAGAATLSWYYPQLSILFYTYALLISYSRPYVGVHYPFDVIAGAIAGLIISFLLTRFFVNRFPAWQPKRKLK